MSEHDRSGNELQEIHEFFGVLAHELRGPLAPLSNGLQILKLQGIDAKTSGDVVALMERQLRQLTTLLDNLLEVSRMVRGKVAMRNETFDLSRLVRVVSQDFLGNLGRSDLPLSLDVPEKPLWVLGDAVRMARALSNLLHNAARSAKSGQAVTVRLTADESAREAELRVCDPGRTRPPASVTEPFRPFPSAGSDAVGDRAGVGLSLALVKGIVELHGGRIDVIDAAAGAGAEFVVRIPIQPEPAAVTAIAAEPAPCAPPKPLRILVIEDNPDSAESLRMLLSACGYDVTVSFTGTDGVRAAQESRPDVVICDIGLPGLDGYGVVHELRRHEETAAARVIALTGYGSEEDRRKSRLAGFDVHLVKPVDPGRLQQLLAASEPAA